ncbi:MAG: hypothetical protein O3B64_00870 [bacterium]|nr:hypothetical protein [bacterium]
MKQVFVGVSALALLFGILPVEPTFFSGISLPLLTAWLLLGGYLTGTALMQKQAPLLQLIFGSSLILAFIAFFGSIIYYIFPVPASVFFGLHLLISSLIYALRPHVSGERMPRTPCSSVTAAMMSLFASTLLFIWIWLGRTEVLTSVRSPWEVLSPLIIIAFIVLIASGYVVATKKPELSLPLSIVSLFSFLIIPSIIYPSGFGFDPFVHAATMQHIADFGTITPKPLYYIGEYVNGLYFHHLFALSFETFNRVFIPLFTAIVVPSGALMILSNQPHTSHHKTRSFLVFLPFLLPLSLFVTTTPQALGFLFAFLAICSSYAYGGRSAQWIFALAALLTHPIAGVPTILFCLYLASRAPNAQPTTVWLRHTSTPLLILTAISLPLTFLAQSFLTDVKTPIDLTQLFSFAPSEQIHATTNSLLSGAYAFLDAQVVLLIAAALVAHIVSKQRTSRPLLLFAGTLLANYYILASSFTFSSVIAYESNSFAERLLPFACLMFLPIIAEFFVAKRPPTSLYIILLLLVAANIYGTFPRHDSFARSGGFNVSVSDIEAVHAIETLANGDAYAVLANQSVSSAALQEFGFAHYYGDQFYYPIPTSSPLYEAYLEMTDTPSLDTIEKARTLTGAELIFFTFNHYWWDADRILEETNAIADFHFTIDDEITIFVFAIPKYP